MDNNYYYNRDNNAAGNANGGNSYATGNTNATGGSSYATGNTNATGGNSYATGNTNATGGSSYTTGGTTYTSGNTYTNTSTYANTGNAYSNGNSQAPKKKKGGTFGKILAAGCMGLAFGVFGGLGFFAVQKTTGMLDAGKAKVEEAAQLEDGGAVNADNESALNNSTDSSTDNQTAVLNTLNGSAESVTGDVSTVADALMPAMVSIKKEYTYTYGNDIYSYYFGGGSQSSQVAEASGSGFIIAQTDTEYLIVSNNHVVEDPLSLEVTFVDGTTASAYIKGSDSQMDVAVIAVQKSDLEDSTKEAIRVVAVGDSDEVKLGEQVVAIGNALGYGQSVTTGIVSAVNRELTLDDGSTGVYIQTDAAINPGNSGGALINMSGEVIGINSSKIGGTAIEGMGYAIPISSVTDIIEEMMEHQTRIPIDESEMGYIGISLQEITETLSQRFGIPVGIYVVEVSEGGGAEAAGIQAGDVITKFDGEKVESYNDLQNILKYYKAGTTVEITYERQEGGQYVAHTAQLTLGTKPVATK